MKGPHWSEPVPPRPSSWLDSHSSTGGLPRPGEEVHLVVGRSESESLADHPAISGRRGHRRQNARSPRGTHAAHRRRPGRRKRPIPGTSRRLASSVSPTGPNPLTQPVPGTRSVQHGFRTPPPWPPGFHPRRTGRPALRQCRCRATWTVRIGRTTNRPSSVGALRSACLLVHRSVQILIVRILGIGWDRTAQRFARLPRGTRGTQRRPAVRHQRIESSACRYGQAPRPPPAGPRTRVVALRPAVR